MKARTRGGAAALAAALALMPALADALDAPSVVRTGPGAVDVRWSGSDPVDIYVAARPGADIAGARLLTRGDAIGDYKATDLDPARPYFILKDERDGSILRVAERLLPLEQGSNFRDIGGYPAAGGKHVRWGMIYRTAAEPMLTDADDAYVRKLGIAAVVDLRSTEERQAIPDQFNARFGSRYYASDYPASSIFSRFVTPSGQPSAKPDAAVSLYRSWLVDLAPQYREIFRQLLKDDGAVSYHCSAGQDRTGVATALILSALGVPREVILQDYHLSTADRRPDYETPRLDPARYPGNIYASLIARMQAKGGPAPAPRPLYDEHGRALLLETFDEIDTRWGGVDAYLDKQLGVGAADIAKLRALYLE